jgi:hypothetical protein
LIDLPFYSYVISERGEQLSRRETRDLDELLYWIFQDVTFRMALDFEKTHRSSGQDFRRLLFSYQLRLLGALQPRWREKRQIEIDTILVWSPFRDEPRDMLP